MVEAFGRWSPYGREVLAVTAARGTVFSGLDNGIALRNLINTATFGGAMNVYIWMLTYILTSLPSGPDCMALSPVIQTSVFIFAGIITSISYLFLYPFSY